MNDQEKAKEEALRQVNLAWKMIQDTLERWSKEPLLNAPLDFGPSPVGDPDAEELQRIFNLESPK